MGTHAIWKASGRLADGREIIYFDETPGLDRVLTPDTRPLAPRARRRRRAPTGRRSRGIRWDALAGEWVVIAAARQDRTFLPPPDQCPLDPSAPGRPTEIPAASYDVVVFENRFPSLREPLGRCEVVCFTSDHDASFAALTPRPGAHRARGLGGPDAGLSALPETRQVYCFENRGEEIGVTLHHPHGQIYAFPFVTPRTAQMVTQAAVPRTHRAATCSTTWSPPSCGRDARSWPATSTGSRSCPRRRAGRTRCGSSLPSGCPTCPRSTRRRGRRSGRSTWTCCGGSTRCSASPRRTSPPGTRPRSGRGRARTVRRAPSGTVGPARRRQAQVPGRDRIGHGRVDQRHRP